MALIAVVAVVDKGVLAVVEVIIDKVLRCFNLLSFKTCLKSDTTKFGSNTFRVFSGKLRQKN